MQIGSRTGQYRKLHALSEPMESAMENRSSTPAPFDLNSFLGAMAHDLANPLNAISMNAELARLLAQKNQTERVAEIVERVLADCSRCSRFLRDLRQFADITKPRAHERIPAQMLIDAAEVNARAAVSGKFPEIQLSGSEATLLVDIPAMEAALSAILRNAAEAGASTIRVTVDSSSDGMRLVFADNGSGLADVAANKAGAAFFSTRRQQGNTGLGLALCSYVVRAHQGELTVRNGTAGGTEVEIRLPA